MPPVTAKVPGDGSNTLTFTIPGSGMDVETVYAEIDGSGAGAAFLGTLSIADQSGVVIAAKPQDETLDAASGDSATWALRLNDKSASTPSVSTGLAMASAKSNSVNFADSGLGFNFVSLTAGSFITNDPTVFESHSSAGTRGIRALTGGQFFVWTSALGQSNAAPAAGSYLRALSTLGSIGDEFMYSPPAGWFLTDSSPLYEAASTYGWDSLIVSPSNPPPVDFFARVGQNSGGTILLNVNMTVVRISTVVES